MKENYLFRGKATNNGEWVTGHLVQGETQEPRIFFRGAYCYVYIKTVGQCTGKRDRTGTLVFEGDVVTVAAGNDPSGSLGYVTGEVLYSDEACGYLISQGKAAVALGHYDTPCVKVKGNIHDDPALMEEYG